MDRAFATVVIPADATTSVATALPLGFVLAGFITPGTLTGTSMSFKGQIDPTNNTLFPVHAYHNGDVLYTITIGPSRLIVLNTEITKALSSFQLVSNEQEAASRTFIAIYVRP